jgi:hypothetical protein
MISRHLMTRFHLMAVKWLVDREEVFVDGVDAYVRRLIRMEAYRKGARADSKRAGGADVGRRQTDAIDKAAERQEPFSPGIHFLAACATCQSLRP